MKNNLFIFVFIFLIFSLQAQKQEDTSIIGYKSVVTKSNKIFVINNIGNLLVWDITKTILLYENTNKRFFLTSIAKDNNGYIYIGTKKGKIFLLNQTDYSVSEYGRITSKDEILGIVFNSKNELFVIIPDGIMEFSTGNIWREFRKPNISGMHIMTFTVDEDGNTVTQDIKKFFTIPEFYFVDNNKILWLVKTFGEFGYWVASFHLNNKHIITMNGDDNYDFGTPRTILSDKRNNIYIISSLQHFRVRSSIKLIKNFKVEKSIKSKELKDENEKKIFINEVIFGASVYFPLNNSIILSTSSGLYEVILKNEGGIDYLKKIIDLKTPLVYGRHQVGYKLTIKKILISENNEIVIVTENDGIGIYNWKDDIKWIK